jgi:hypothetical protein
MEEDVEYYIQYSERIKFGHTMEVDRRMVGSAINAVHEKDSFDKLGNIRTLFPKIDSSDQDAFENETFTYQAILDIDLHIVALLCFDDCNDSIQSVRVEMKYCIRLSATYPFQGRCH